MYNLLVTASDGAWDIDSYEYDKTRFLEYTAESIKGKFKPLTAEGIEEIKSLPTLFMYENSELTAHIGYIRRIRERGRTILIEYEIDKSIGSFTYAQLKALQVKLDINGSEFSRTHWAIKDENLFEVLGSANLVDASLAGEGRPAGRVEEMRFKVAVSFPGEKREYVSSVVAEVKKKLPVGSVFYDKDFTAQLARPNIDTVLQKIYLNNSDLVVVFLCEDYEKKTWCGLEWRSIRTIIKNKNDHAIMFMRFDGAEVDGSLPIDGYVDLQEYDPIQVARMIVERVRLNDDYPKK